MDFHDDINHIKWILVLIFLAMILPPDVFHKPAQIMLGACVILAVAYGVLKGSVWLCRRLWRLVWRWR